MYYVTKRRRILRLAFLGDSMKKFLILCLSFIMVFATMVLTGCGAADLDNKADCKVIFCLQEVDMEGNVKIAYDAENRNVLFTVKSGGALSGVNKSNGAFIGIDTLLKNQLVSKSQADGKLYSLYSNKDGSMKYEVAEESWDAEEKNIYIIVNVMDISF